MVGDVQFFSQKVKTTSSRSVPEREKGESRARLVGSSQHLACRVDVDVGVSGAWHQRRTPSFVRWVFLCQPTPQSRRVKGFLREGAYKQRKAAHVFNSVTGFLNVALMVPR